tara:strand:+ start:249 stop:701 length:453 start_codon:yes stop_codon:yes gene_type:complete
MVSNGLTWVDLLEEGMYEGASSMKAELSYPNPGEPAKFTLKFPGSIGISGTGINPFQLRVEVDNINSYNAGDNYTQNAYGSVNTHVYDYWDSYYDVTFTQVDVANEVFSGTIDIQFYPLWHADPIINEANYPTGTSTDFTVTIDFYFDND